MTRAHWRAYWEIGLLLRKLVDPLYASIKTVGRPVQPQKLRDLSSSADLPPRLSPSTLVLSESYRPTSKDSTARAARVRQAGSQMKVEERQKTGALALL